MQKTVGHWFGWRRESILDVYNLLLAAFLFAAPWLLSFQHGVAIVNADVTAAVLIAATVASLLHFAMWEEFIVAAGAAWLIVSPWVLGFAHTRAMHLAIGIGGVMLFIAALDLWMTRYGEEDEIYKH
jgi:hypothetical protein